MKHELLRLEEIAFGEHGQKTLSGFSMAHYQGEILGLFSNHLAVKNDVVNVIAGRKGAQAGRLYFENRPWPFEDADPQRLRKVGVVGAAKTLIDDFSVAENIFVIRRGLKAQVIRSRVLHRQTQQLMEEFGLAMQPDSLVRNLAAVERCSLEIVKAVALGARIVILQDPSGFLSDFEIDQLLSFVERLKHKELGFLMVDSAVNHLLHYADRVIVIKNGRNFWTFGRGEVSDEIVKVCFAREPSIDVPTVPSSPAAVHIEEAPALAFEAVQSRVLEPLSFTLYPGEELCIVDQGGTAIDEIKALLSGERQPATGRILVDGKPFRARNAWEALDQKIAFVVENPAETMLFPEFTALENLCFPASKKTQGFWINPAYLASCRREYEQYFDQGVLTRYPDELSTQDLQKLVYCRWHLFNPKLVVCIKPFSSVEKSLEEISAFFIELLQKKGIAVLILASNASEASARQHEIRLPLASSA